MNGRFLRIWKSHLSFNLMLLTVVMLFPCYTLAEESRWEFAGKIEDDAFLLYIDNQSVSYMSENSVRFRIRKELTPERVDELRKSFDEDAKKLEPKLKAEVLEELFQDSIKGHTKEQTYDIYCDKNEVWIHPPKASFINYITSNPILPGTTEEKLKLRLCKKGR